ncbi:hypothetical protein [Chryseobacterium sp. 5_R23647]|uniref:hypothetical protein n=1 Tax=Chryseobacterium sp. 5_R23647 TaxID=2258964 RepID=UPI000E2868CC|nr:hypothetical protein [Chryseobacterium sp. 5_R23647]REC39838.1 hypothetical protein DRF69_21245 [Chryseobacterium sp. 5_R23647]
MDKENELSAALDKAKKQSKNDCSYLFVIKSLDPDTDEDVYYIDDNGLIRTWEELIAIFENGIRTQ